MGSILSTSKKASAFEVPKRWDYEADIVIIGCGGAGATSAIIAHDMGRKILILEKEPIIGGNTILSGGIVYAANTSVQKEAGIHDSEEGMYKYWMAINNNLLDEEIVKILSYESKESIEWLKNLGVKFSPNNLYYSGLEEEYKDITPPVKRGHTAEGKGKGIMDALKRALDSRQIKILLRTKAERLFVNAKGEIVGILAKRKEETINIKAKRAIILTTGGFSQNKDLIKSYFPLLLKAVPFTAPGLTGDGLLMAQKIGAPIVDTGCLELPASLPALEVIPGKKALMFSSAYFLYKYPAIFVNKEGKRFCDESGYYQIIVPLILKEKIAWIIFDEVVKKELGGKIGYGFSSDLSNELASGVLMSASTITELAKKLEIDPSALEQTTNNFNENSLKGIDPEFGRKKALGPIKTPPFYGGKLTAANVDTFGGLKFNKNAQVLDPYGLPIPRLYAAGAVGTTVKAYPGSGTWLSFCFTFGRIAGKNAAMEKPWS